MKTIKKMAACFLSLVLVAAMGVGVWLYAEGLQPTRIGIRHNSNGTVTLRYPKALKDELGENITIYCGCGETHCFSLQN